MYMTNRPMLARMKKKPKRVTMFGAIHSGKTLTKAFHCETPETCQLCRRLGFSLGGGAATIAYGRGGTCGESKGNGDDPSPVLVRRARNATYPWTKNVFRHGGFIDARILVRLEVYQRIVRDALGGSIFYQAKGQQAR